MEEAETVARQILRNSQRAVRSAKQTILDIDRPAARRAAPDRGLERLHLRRPRGDAWRCSGASTRRPTPGAPASTRPGCDMPRRWRVGLSSPGPPAGSAPRSPSACATDGLEVTTLDRDEGCDLQLDLAAGRAPRPDRDRRLRLERGDHRHDRTGPPDEPGAVVARHRRQPDRRLPRGPGLPARDARAPLGPDRRDLLRRRQDGPAAARSPTPPRRPGCSGW